jgi:hypothetical protein
MSTLANQLDPDQLITLLSQQRDLYVQLRELSDRQRSLIAGDRPELLLTILSERQELVTLLARLNGQLAPFRRDWDAMYAALPEDRRSQASSLLQEVNGLLRVILQTDHEDSALLSVRKQTVAASMAGLASGQAANSAYAKQAAASVDARAADMTG